MNNLAIMTCLLTACTPGDNRAQTPPDALACPDHQDARAEGCDGRGVPLSCGPRPTQHPLHFADFADANGDVIDKQHVILIRIEFLQEVTYRHDVEVWIDCVLAGDQ